MGVDFGFVFVVLAEGGDFADFVWLVGGFFHAVHARVGAGWDDGRGVVVVRVVGSVRIDAGGVSVEVLVASDFVGVACREGWLAVVFVYCVGLVFFGDFGADFGFFGE